MIDTWRSLLFVSAADEGRIERAHLRCADAVILDLEDAVPTMQKNAARATLRRHVERLHSHGQDVVVRINANWRGAFADLDVAVIPGVAAIMVPKIEDAARIATISAICAEFEEARTMDSGSIAIIALIESAAGLAVMNQVAALPHVVGLALGSEDFALSLGVAPTSEMLDLPCRQLALAAAAHGRMAFGIPISIADFADVEAYRAAAGKAKAYGATGSICIHPTQVAAINDIFAPDAGAVEEAEAIVTAWEAGDGGVVNFAGRMIDLPVVERAKRLLVATAAHDNA